MLFFSLWELILRLVVKGREVIYKQDFKFSGTVLLKVVKESDVKRLIHRNCHWRCSDAEERDSVLCSRRLSGPAE